MARLSGKVAIITGSASGIGKEIAKRFAAEDAKVVIADLQETAAQATANEISQTGAVAMGVPMDVSDESAVEAGVAAAAERFGGVDILVSNAGIQIVKPIDEFPFAEWKRMLAIHLDGAFLTTKACLRHMYKGRGGAIIYMCTPRRPRCLKPLTSPRSTAWLASARSSPRKAPSTGCGRTSSAPASCGRLWWTSRYQNRQRRWGFPRTRSSTM